MNVELTYQQELKQKTAKPLLWISLVSIVMFFAGLTSAVIVSKGSSEWISFTMPSYFLVSTIVILISSLTMHYGYFSIKKDNTTMLVNMLILTFLLGAAFIVTQLFAWENLYLQGIFAAGENSRPVGSYFYALTALHILHLVGGLISLIVVMVRAIQKKYSSSNHLGLQLSLTYWHFLTGLWVYLYLFLTFIA